MIKISTAKDSMIPELKNILKVCFNEHDGAIELLFKEKFIEEMTVVCTVDDKVVSSVYIFENNIIYNNKEIPSCYMYAVATLPEFQGMGYMKKLLNYAENVARNQGKIFSTLYPADKELYKFYEKLSYRHFFKTCIVEVDRSKIEKNLYKYVKHNKLLKCCQYEAGILTSMKMPKEINYSHIAKIRRNVYNKTGEVCWDENTIKYAVEVNNFYGGSTVLEENSYAICRRNNDIVEILDCAFLPSDLLLLIAAIDDKYKAQKYVFRLPAGSQLFGQFGRDVPFGMIKPLTYNEQYNKILSEMQNPYLGLVMD